MEVLMNKLRKLKLGLNIGRLSLWSTAFADDLTMFLKSNNELRAALKVFNEYREVSGLEINYNKSEIMELNYVYDISIGIPVKNRVKITGVWFSLDKDEMVMQNWEDVCTKVSRKLNNWKGRNLSEMGKSTIVKAQISPIVLYVATVIPLPQEVEKNLSKMTYRFIGNNSEKESRALLCQKKDKGGLEIPNWKIKCSSAMALWAFKATKSSKPWTKLFSEPGIDWNSTNALATVRPVHGVEGFIGQCITEYYKSAALLPQSDNALVWPYVLPQETSNMMRKKCPDLTFAQASICLPANLNFLERNQVKSALDNAFKTFKKQCSYVAYEGKKYIQKDLNCIKWPKPIYNLQGELRPLGEGRLKDHLNWLEETLVGTEISSLCSLKTIYWLKIKHIVPPPHPFRNKIEAKYGIVVWSQIDKQKVSTFSKVQAFQWRSTHGKLYANKNFHAMGIKESPRCMFCEEESQSLTHLFLECSFIKKLYACFERQYNLEEKLTDLEKIIGVDPSRCRSKLISKKLAILRRMIYQNNHRDEKPRWGQFIDLVDRIYTIEYAIVDRNGKIFQHLEHWEK